jgi:hypothetical protein
MMDNTSKHVAALRERIGQTTACTVLSEEEEEEDNIDDTAMDMSMDEEEDNDSSVHELYDPAPVIQTKGKGKAKTIPKARADDPESMEEEDESYVPMAKPKPKAKSKPKPKPKPKPVVTPEESKAADLVAEFARCTYVLAGRSVVKQYSGMLKTEFVLDAMVPVYTSASSVRPRYVNAMIMRVPKKIEDSVFRVEGDPDALLTLNPDDFINNGADRRFDVLHEDKLGMTRLKAVLLYIPDTGLRLVFPMKGEKEMLKATGTAGKSRTDYSAWVRANSVDARTFHVSDPILFGAGKSVEWTPAIVKALFGSKKRKAEEEGGREVNPPVANGKEVVVSLPQSGSVYDFVRTHGAGKTVSMTIQAEKLIPLYRSSPGDLFRLVGGCELAVMDVSLKGKSFSM